MTPQLPGIRLAVAGERKHTRGAGAARVVRDRDSGLYLGGVLISGFGYRAMLLVAGIW
jgi:hypothetical protein